MSVNLAMVCFLALASGLTWQSAGIVFQWTWVQTTVEPICATCIMTLLYVYVLYVHVLRVCRIESVKLKVTDKEKMQGTIVSSGKDGLVKYWDLQRYKLIMFLCHSILTHFIEDFGFQH